MEVLARRCGDTEGLLHKTVCLVTVALRLAIILILVAGTTRLRGLAIVSPPIAEATASLALHLAVGEEAAGDSAGAPRLAVCPSPHASLALIPNKH